MPNMFCTLFTMQPLGGTIPTLHSTHGHICYLTFPEDGTKHIEDMGMLSVGI